jgi:hypothetical protein
MMSCHFVNLLSQRRNVVHVVQTTPAAGTWYSYEKRGGEQKRNKVRNKEATI